MPEGGGSDIMEWLRVSHVTQVTWHSINSTNSCWENSSQQPLITWVLACMNISVCILWQDDSKMADLLLIVTRKLLAASWACSCHAGMTYSQTSGLQQFTQISWPEFPPPLSLFLAYVALDLGFAFLMHFCVHLFNFHFSIFNFSFSIFIFQIQNCPARQFLFW